MIIMSVHHHHHQHHHHQHHHGASSSSSSSLFFYIGFKCPVRPDLRCRRCVDMIMMTAGDAEDVS